ncbi:MAG: hypothetical protein JWM55_1454 [Acidimicrobiaceae bacterium]|nr:hypothetical protein [Acidimicrobiaceae bacterium]
MTQLIRNDYPTRMSWDSRTDTDYRVTWGWARRLATDEPEPLGFVLGTSYDTSNQSAVALRPEARRCLAAVRDLAATHL